MSRASRMGGVLGVVIAAAALSIGPFLAGSALGPGPVMAGKPDKTPPGHAKPTPAPSPVVTPAPTPKATPRPTPRPTAKPTTKPKPVATPRPGATARPDATTRPDKATSRPVASGQPAPVAASPSADAVVAAGSVAPSVDDGSGGPLLAIGLVAILLVGGASAALVWRRRSSEAAEPTLQPGPGGLPRVDDGPLGDPLLAALDRTGTRGTGYRIAPPADEPVPSWVKRLGPDLQVIDGGVRPSPGSASASELAPDHRAAG